MIEDSISNRKFSEKAVVIHMNVGVIEYSCCIFRNNIQKFCRKSGKSESLDRWRVLPLADKKSILPYISKCGHTNHPSSFGKIGISTRTKYNFEMKGSHNFNPHRNANRIRVFECAEKLQS